MKNQERKINGVNCEEAVSRFNDFIDKYLKGIAREELQHHIDNCRHCFERVEFEKLLKAKIASLSSVNAVEENSANNSVNSILKKIFGS